MAEMSITEEMLLRGTLNSKLKADLIEMVIKLEKRSDRLMHIIERLASSEAFGPPGIISPGKDWASGELARRMDYARMELERGGRG